MSQALAQFLAALESRPDLRQRLPAPSATPEEAARALAALSGELGTPVPEDEILARLGGELDPDDLAALSGGVDDFATIMRRVRQRHEFWNT